MVIVPHHLSKISFKVHLLNKNLSLPLTLLIKFKAKMEHVVNLCLHVNLHHYLHHLNNVSQFQNQKNVHLHLLHHHLQLHLLAVRLHHLLLHLPLLHHHAPAKIVALKKKLQSINQMDVDHYCSNL